MEKFDFRNARELLNNSPGSKWISIISSILTSFVTILLVPVVYLTVNLLVSSGRIPDFHELPALTQRHVMESCPQNIPATSHWNRHVTEVLTKRVSAEAADSFHRGSEMGLLPAIVQNEDNLAAPFLGFFARWNGWMWSNGYSIFGLFVIASTLILIRGLLVNLAAYFSCGAAVSASSRLRRNIYNHSYRIGALAIRPELQSKAGDHITTHADEIQDGYLVWLTAGFRGPSLIIISTITLLLINFWVGIAALFLSASLWLLAGQVIAWYRRDARLASRRTESRLAMLRENLMHMQLAKSYLTERFSQTRVERHLSDLTRTTRRRLRGETVSRQLLFTLSMLASCFLIFLATRAVNSGAMTLAGLSAQGLTLTTLLIGINRWVITRVRVRRADAASNIVFEFLDQRADVGQAVDAEFLPAIKKKIEFVEVSYREPESGRVVLDKVSFTVNIGSRTAIACSHPDESLAIAYLLTRFLEPTGGEIRIDGRNIRWVTHESLRAQIAMTLTDLTTFSDTVADNIGCGDPNFTRPQIIEAAKSAHAHQFIQRLPYGYETILGDVGHSLLYGEKYRIALARAILHDPSVMIIEEPFEPFDRDSVALIDDALGLQTGRTLIYLARRKRTMRNAERLIVINDGKIVDTETENNQDHSSD